MLTCERCHEKEVSVLLTSRIPAKIECIGLCQPCADILKAENGGQVPGYVIDSYPGREMTTEVDRAWRTERT